MSEVSTLTSEVSIYALQIPQDGRNDTFFHTRPPSPVPFPLDQIVRMFRPLPTIQLCRWLLRPFNMSRYTISFSGDDWQEVTHNQSRDTNYVPSLIDHIYEAAWSDEIMRTLEDLDTYVSDEGYEEQRAFADSRVQAKLFFERFAGLLPSKPFIYPTTKGELLAEINDEKCSITMIFMQNDIGIFSGQDGEKHVRIVKDWQHTRSRMVEVLEQELEACQG